MSDVQPTMNDTIDLFELVEVLWSEKVVIGYFLAVAFLVGGLVIINHEYKYESIVKYQFITPPPFVPHNEILADFYDEFHSEGTFSQWSKTMPNTKLSLDDVLPTVFDSGIIYGADIEQEAIVFVQKNIVFIRSNDIGLIFDSIKYMEFAANVLSQRYVKESGKQYERLKVLSNRILFRIDLPALERLSELDTYLSRVKDGRKLVSFSLPSKPTKVGPLKEVMLAVSVMIGGFVGVVFVLVRSIYRKRMFTSANLVG